jgi:hypothetical protein
MRKVLAVTLAILLAAIVISPAMGYSFKALKSPYPFSNAIGEKANFSISAGVPAHEMTPEESAAGASAPRYSISSTKVPYSFNTAGAVKYSMQAGSQNQNAARLGQGQTTAKTTPVEAPATTTAVATPVATPVAEATPVNTTEAVSTPAPSAELTISGVAYEDVNGNGVKDADETGIAGAVIDLAQPAATIINNATTSEDGSYSFTGLMAGEYTVSTIAPDGWALTAPADGYYTVTLTDANEAARDFGFQMKVAPAGNATESAPVETVPVEIPTNTTTIA